MRPICIAFLIAALATAGWGQDRPIELRLQLRGETSKMVAGELVRWDDEQVLLRTAEGEQAISWLELEPLSAFRARSRLIDREKAADWLALGRMGWSMGLREAAQEALSRATRLDPSLAEQAEQITAQELGWALPAEPEAVAAPAAPPSTPLPDIPAGHGEGRPDRVVEYGPVTPEQYQAAIEHARRRTAEVEVRLGMKLQEFQTDHFIVFTDWDPREYRFLEQNLEGAYRAVARVFDQDPRQNIFEGKLAIYMFNRQEDFRRFGQTYGGMRQVPEEMAGYFAWHGQIIHMAMWKPPVRPGMPKQAAEIEWAYVLAHEFVHAFVFRYKTNRVPPQWINEGLAETVAMRLFPLVQDRTEAAKMAATTPSLQPMFSDPALQRKFEYYSVHRTLIETLIAADRKAFIRWFEAIKYGADPEDALKKHFGWDYPQLERMWRRYVATTSRR